MSSQSTIATEAFLPFMRDVMRCESSLRELNLIWRMIESTAKMNCPVEAQTILPMMAATREGFARLETELVSSLAHESLSEVLAEIGTQAHHVIDIVVRNLYERTADVGFLATDQELCRYLAGPHAERGAVTARLREYRNKYTVYDEIMLLDLQGNVLAQIDEESPVEGSRDPLVAQTLQATGYVETFRQTDLRPHKHKALIYSRTMHHPQTGQPVGILCLSFGFEDEMQGIFHSRREEESPSIMLLLDADNRVIASADPDWIATGLRVPVNPDACARVQLHSGRAYLVRTCMAQGYQGYPGPAGWKGQVMTPVDLAFSNRVHRAIDGLDPGIASGLLSHARTFCPPLFEIVSAADTIRRVVWNGQVMTASQRGELQKLKTVLDQISEAGARTNELFTQSIRNLYDTVLTSSMRDGEFLTCLLVDLLDRNLYERADDCRWWALTPELRAALAAPALDADGTGRLHALLETINGLYTVYTRLVVYDRQGRIVAASNPGRADGSTVIGETIEAEALQAVLALRGTQAYHVTPFQPSPLYEGEPTYIYHAAIRAPDDERVVVGGIGIVFHAGEEFRNMLLGGIAEKKNAKAFYVNRAGRVLASTDPLRPVGSRLELSADLLALPNGESRSRALVHDGQYAIVGCSASNGYREFKVSDGYQEDVLGVCFESFGAVRSDADDIVHRACSVLQSGANLAQGVEVATFFIDAGLYALPAEAVVEALPGHAVSPVSAGKLPWRVGTLARRSNGGVTGFVWVFDLGHMLRGRPSERGQDSQVIVIRHGGVEVGLLVNELHGVPAFPPHEITELPFLGEGEHSLVTRVIRANQGELLIQCLDVTRLVAQLSRRAAAGVESPGPLAMQAMRAAAAPLSALPV